MGVYQILCLVGLPSLTGITGFLIAKIKTAHSTNQALKLGLQALLRDRLLQAYYHYMSVGKMSFMERENIKNIYNQYHSLGANGIMTDYYNELMDLPKQEEDGNNGQRN